MRRILPLIVIFMLSACASSPLKLSSYSGGKSLYPAVHKIFSDYHLGFAKVDINNEQYVSDFYYGKDLLLNLRFHIHVVRLGNQIAVSLDDMANQDANGIWSFTNTTIAFNINKFRNQLSQKISSAMNSAQYTKYRAEALSDLGFISHVLYDMPKAGRQDWYRENMQNRIYSINFPLENVVYSKSKYGKFLVSFNTGNPLSDIDEQTAFSQHFDLAMYTNNTRYEYIKKGTEISTHGKFVASNIGYIDMLGDTLYLVEAQ
ncbi:MAG: hypothetical protein GC149_03110 [Gammaproteobacteria bacterium]|nr:hypothetical protein [Gammaproteobacteria bacterium]